MTESHILFRDAFAACPLVAILRGVVPDEIEEVADVLVDAGLTIFEVPLHSPAPYGSIARLARRHGARILIGAGTVLSATEVARVAEAGGRLIVSPNVDAAVIRASIDAGLISLPGYLTPSEAFAALAAGATGLKLIPAEGDSPAFLKGQKAVLSSGIPVLNVGGITPELIPAWTKPVQTGLDLAQACIDQARRRRRCRLIPPPTSRRSQRFPSKELRGRA